jgi:lipid-binding SYLF domain-containing protein
MIRVATRIAAAFGALVLIFAFPAGPARAATFQEIDEDVDRALADFYKEVADGRDLVAKAQGALVFPNVVKAGIGIGGEYGEGALRVRGKTVDYYSTAAASIGFQLGAQSKRVILVFLQEQAFQKFRSSPGWEVGVDGSVAVVKVGAGGKLDTTTLNQPIVAFVFGQRGLMYNLTLEGSKFSKLKK